MPKGHEQMWLWNGSMEFPSFRPSILSDLEMHKGRNEVLCHHFVERGIVKFCGDCPKEFANKELPL